MIDTHCHIDLYPKPMTILDECEKAGFPILSMTNLPSHFEKGYPFFQNKVKVRQAIGMHPLYAEQHKNEFPKFLKNLSRTSYIGEVGLDFSQEGISTKELQVETFEKILNAIANQKKILSIHSRRAEREVLELLKKYQIENAIFHWYSGSLNVVNEITQSGYYFSINPAMVKSSSGKKIITKIPKEFILTETDGPFIIENNLPLKPGQVQSVLIHLSNEWKMSIEEVEKIIRSNFNKILSQIK